MYEFRAFKEGDLFEVMKIVNTEMKYEYSPDIYLSLQKAWPGGFIVVTYYQRIIGFIMCGITPIRSVRILLLVLRKEFTSRGIGNALVEKIIERTKARGLHRLTLEVRVGNAKAISFYKKMGFRSIDIAKGFYKDGEDAYILEKVLSN